MRRSEKMKREVSNQGEGNIIVLSLTRTFAAGCSTSSCLRIVAPSLVTVTSPMLSTYARRAGK